MQYRNIITRAWDLTKEHTYLNWLVAVPLAIEFVIGSVYFPLRWGLYIMPDIFSRTYSLIEHQYAIHRGETTTFLIFFAVTIVLYLLVPTFCEGALIGTVAKMLHSGEQSVKKQFSIAYGLNVYLPLVELHAMTSALNPLYVFLTMSLLHQFNTALFDLLFFPALFLFVIEVIIMISVIYAKYELVIHRSGVMESIKKSFNLVLFNISETFFILMLLVLIIIRALVNFLIVFLIPALIYVFCTYFISYITPTYIIYSLVGLGALAAYYYLLKTASMLGVFMTIALVITFFELNEKNEDVIIKDKPKESESQQDQAKATQDALTIIGKTLMSEMQRLNTENKLRMEQELNLPRAQEPKQITGQTVSETSKSTFANETQVDSNAFKFTVNIDEDNKENNN